MSVFAAQCLDQLSLTFREVQNDDDAGTVHAHFGQL
jgi:hypothetical protein